MNLIKKFSLRAAMVLVVAGSSMLWSQTEKVDYKAKLVELQKQRRELYQQMTEASKTGDLNAYNAARNKYTKLGEEIKLDLRPNQRLNQSFPQKPRFTYRNVKI